MLTVVVEVTIGAGGGIITPPTGLTPTKGVMGFIGFAWGIAKGKLIVGFYYFYFYLSFFFFLLSRDLDLYDELDDEDDEDDDDESRSLF